MKFKVWVRLPGEPNCTNAITHDSIESAKAAGKELLSRWMAPIGFSVAPETCTCKGNGDCAECHAFLPEVTA